MARARRHLLSSKSGFCGGADASYSTKEFNTSDTYVFAQGLGFSPEVGLELICFEGGEINSKRSAINDIDDSNASDLPNRHQFSGERFERNGKVRVAVIRRANGFCEHCGVAGFIMPSGRAYLEAHHIISLAKQGPDSLSNVIALCPNDHRQAHFGANWMQLENEFKEKLAKLQGKK